MEHCIRECADINQLRRCKEEIDSARISIHQISNILNLAGNEVRLKILYLLFKEDQMCPCDLSDVLEMTVPAVSQHLKKLSEGEILNKVRSGKTIFYSLNKSRVDLLAPMFEQIANEEQNSKQRNEKETIN